MSIIDRTHKGTWVGRSLENYKSMHKKTAVDKGVEKELAACSTLTKARKILWGLKSKNTR